MSRREFYTCNSYNTERLCQLKLDFIVKFTNQIWVRHSGSPKL